MGWLKETGRILRFVGFGLLVATIATTLVDQFINTRLEALLLSDDGGGAQLWILAAGSLFNGLIFPVLITGLTIFGILRARGAPETLSDFLARTGQQLYIETLRAWGACLRWGFLLIIPGLVRLIQLIYVPFIVCLDRKYDQGEADALRTSNRYFRRAIARTLLAMAAFHVILPLVVTDLLDPWRTFTSTPGPALLCSLVDLILAVFAAQVFFRIFESVRKELLDEPVFQLERHQDPGQGTHV